MASTELLDIKANNVDGKEVTLNSYQGKVLLIVNTASRCGYTPQYAGLQKLQEKYEKKGFTVLGFPSNDFNGQEPGTNAEIKKFCQLNYKVNFPLFAKNPVSGPEIQPIYKYLTANAPEKGPIDWNFEKFLVSRSGEIVGRFKSKVAPDDTKLVSALEQALKVPAKAK